MESMFYAIMKPVSLRDIAEVARAHGYACEYSEGMLGPRLVITTRSTVCQQTRRKSDSSIIDVIHRPTLWDWGDYLPYITELEPADHEKVLALQAAHIYQIDYRMSSREELLQFLGSLLQRYGGLVSVDGYWDTLFDVTTITSARASHG